MLTIMTTIYGLTELYQSYIDARRYAFESDIIKQFATFLGINSNTNHKESNPFITVELKDILNIFPSVRLKELAQNTNTLLVLCPR